MSKLVSGKLGEPLLIMCSRADGPSSLLHHPSASTIPSQAPGVGNYHAAGWSALHGAVLSLFVPAKLGFTYVQTALLWVVAAYDMRQPAKDKDFYYDLGAVVVGVPVGLVAWVEALACDSFFKSMGGHVWCNGIIPRSLSLLLTFDLLTH